MEGMRLAPDSVILNVPLGGRDGQGVPDIWAPALDGADGPSGEATEAPDAMDMT